MSIKRFVSFFSPGKESLLTSMFFVLVRFARVSQGGLSVEDSAYGRKSIKICNYVFRTAEIFVSRFSTLIDFSL